MYTAEEAFDIATRKGQPEQTHIDMTFNGGWRLQGDFWELSFGTSSQEMMPKKVL